MVDKLVVKGLDQSDISRIAGKSQPVFKITAKNQQTYRVRDLQ